MYDNGPSIDASVKRMEMRTFHGAIKECRVTLGAASTLGSVLCSQILARAGFDWILIDMEHTPTSPREATQLTQAIVASSAGQCVPIIRVPSHGVEWIKWALDSGVGGIIVPMVTCGSEAEAIIQKAIYPPIGQRSFGPFLAPYADIDSTSDVPRYLSERVKDVAIILMIESVVGVENAEDILSVQGVTGCFIGPYDLRQSMGLPGGDGEEAEYIHALGKIVEICKRRGLSVGTVALTEAATKKRTEMGFDFLLCGQDPNFLASAAKNAWQQCNKGRTAARANS